MKPSDLPGLNGYFRNSLALNRELARAIGYIQTARYRGGAEPASAAKLKEALQAAIDFIDAGDLTPPGP